MSAIADAENPTILPYVPLISVCSVVFLLQLRLFCCRLDLEHGGTANCVVFQGVECLIGAIEREDLDARADRDFCRNGQKIISISSRIVSDTADRSLVVKLRVLKRRNRTHMNPYADYRAPSLDPFQSRHDQLTRRCKDDCGV